MRQAGHLQPRNNYSLSVSVPDRLDKCRAHSYARGGMSTPTGQYAARPNTTGDYPTMLSAVCLSCTKHMAGSVPSLKRNW
jgi:hypothetical protein